MVQRDMSAQRWYLTVTTVLRCNGAKAALVRAWLLTVVLRRVLGLETQDSVDIVVGTTINLMRCLVLPQGASC